MRGGQRHHCLERPSQGAARGMRTRASAGTGSLPGPVSGILKRPMDLPPSNRSQGIAPSLKLDIVGPQRARKNSGSHIDASLSRQPLVKGERLVRYEVNAVMPPGGGATCHHQCCTTPDAARRPRWLGALRRDSRRLGPRTRGTTRHPTLRTTSSARASNQFRSAHPHAHPCGRGNSAISDA